MAFDPTRRLLLRAAPWLALLTAGRAVAGDIAHAADSDTLRLGPAQPFDFERLRQRARALAARDYRPLPIRHPHLLDRIDYDRYQQIRYRSADALWRDSRRPYPVEFFHLGRYARRPVEIYALADRMARQVRYSPDLFDYGRSGLRAQAPADLGFAGFRVMHDDHRPGDWLAYMGASYFRSAGTQNQYGLSARGVAVDTTAPGTREEFPDFTTFWLEEPPGADEIVVYALLDGPSLTGAYRMRWRKEREAVTTDISAELFQRRDIAQLGVAPLTSMYWYSETNQRTAPDWHPEIHDSDGLALWTGQGERIWVPLNNPPRVQTNSYQDLDPKGFGLLQRDRDFRHYLDDSTYYDRRPSVWVEPQGAWGKGAVVLVEIPTTDETSDNIVAFWQPARGARAGDTWPLTYRLHWAAHEPFPPAVAHVVGTRLGQPGIPGQHTPRDPHGRKFVIEFTGGPLADMPQRFDIKPVVTASRGSVSNAFVLKILGTDLWRAQFDLHTEGAEPIDLRCYLRLGDSTLSETWLYQYWPGNNGFTR
ncbi:glucan biosynthesis protein [Acidihalobacter prosperus]|uniref:Glucan biosynthesis periplasmic MdoG C-terminal domain-containing protein n=1 Tax=Acidihalobacter prosperus TaxID=160660 RepID=A0A1A6C1F5_9GAMM|nr:glucan biosynthesis protein D [Acidihalobacter prosperus]OBS08401.1 hypothetical protein Thpro_022651 [Acidihalobacter prosperus]